MPDVDTFRGLCYPNRIGRLCYLSLEEVLGKRGVQALLHLADLPHYIDAYPPNDLRRAYRFEEYAATSVALSTIYGQRGARGLELRAGRVGFTLGLRDFGSLLGMADLALKLMPVSMKLKIVLNGVAQVFDRFSDQSSYLQESKAHFLYHITRCSNCIGRSEPSLNFFFARGILEESAWISGGRRFAVEQCSCMAQGAESCAFAVAKEPLD